MRTSNVDQVIAKHALQALFSSSPRPPDSSSIHFHQVHHFFRGPFSEFLILMENSSSMPAGVCEIGAQEWS
jgi:hypothetical protein